MKRFKVAARTGLALILAVSLCAAPVLSVPVYAVEETKADTETDPAVEESAEAGTSAGEEYVSVMSKKVGAKEKFVISDAADWAEFARLTHDAEWSSRRTIELNADIDLTGEETPRIMYFAGTFDGRGHTIKGISIRSEISKTGLFEQLANIGTIRNLSVTGAVLPAGRQSTMAGLVGVNYGTIADCSYFGSVDAHTEVGGIAGKNAENGVITGCKAGGIIQGDSYTGGIVGYNEGVVSDCVNEAQVNTVYTDVPFSTDELTLTLDALLQTGRITTVENADQKTDSGGIAGFSSGLLEGCRNEGRIGYEHVGFNTGGIAGRSTGLIKNCTNNAEVIGRREIGGVVGQQQPDLTVIFSESSLGQIDTALDELQVMIDNALTDTENYSSDTSARLSSLGILVGNAKGNVQTLTGEASNRADELATKLNNATGAVKASLTDLAEATRQIIQYSKELSTAFASFEQALREWMANASLTEEERTKLRDAMSRMDVAAESMDSLSDEMKAALAVQIKDEQKSEMMASISSMTNSYSDMLSALSDVQRILDTYEAEEGADVSKLSADIELLDRVVNPIRKGMNGDSESEAILKLLNAESQEFAEFCENPEAVTLTELVGRLEAIQYEMSSFTGISEENKSKLQRDLDAATGLSDEDRAALQAGITRIVNAKKSADDSLENLETVIGNIYEGMTPEERDEVRTSLLNSIMVLGEMVASTELVLGELGEYASRLPDIDRTNLNNAAAELENKLKNMPDLSELLPGALMKIANADMEVKLISPTARAAGNDLYNTIDQMIAQSEDLNGALKGVASGTVGNLKQINDQMGKLGDLVRQAVDEQLNRSLDPEDYTTDVSDVDFESASTGRTTGCTNTGTITADSDVGGITGLMGVNLELNPERDLSMLTNGASGGATQEKDIVDGCTNEGFVTCKNNYAGGVVGRMTMGMVHGCENKGRINADGKYAGGIAGFSSALIRQCMVRAEINALDYAGGIVGKGTKLFDNNSMATVTGALQRAGTIAGEVEDIRLETVARNVYVGGNYHAISDVDYEGKAYKVAEVELAEGSARFFNTVRVTFVADGEEIAVINTEFGSDIPKGAIPEVPYKEGFVGVWSDNDFNYVTREKRVEAIYTRILTLIQGELTRDGKHMFFVEGDFAPGDAVKDEQTFESAGEERFTITIPSDGAWMHKIRFLPDPAMGDPIIYVQQNGGEYRLRAEQLGKYLVIEASGSRVNLRVTEDNSIIRRYGPYILIGVAVAAVLAIIIAVIRVILKCRRSVSSAKNQETEDSSEP